MDNTLQGLKKGKILQTFRRLFGSKMPGKHMVKTLSGSEKKKYYSIPVEDRLTKHDIEQGTTTISNLGSIYREHKGMCAILEIIPPQTMLMLLKREQLLLLTKTATKRLNQGLLCRLLLQSTTEHLITAIWFRL